MNIKNRNDKIKEMVKNGLSYGSVAKLFNLSRARIHQICSGYKSPSDQPYKLRKLYSDIILRDKLTCQWGNLCKGKFVEQKNLVIHHINFNNQDNRQENLITLCKKCHASFHSTNHIDKKIAKRLNIKGKNGIKHTDETKRKIKMVGVEKAIILREQLKEITKLNKKGLSSKKIGRMVGLPVSEVRYYLEIGIA